MPTFGQKLDLFERLEQHLIALKLDPKTFLFAIGSILRQGIRFETQEQFEEFYHASEIEDDNQNDSDQDMWNFGDEAEIVVQEMSVKTDFDAICDITRDFEACYTYLKSMGVLRKEPPSCPDKRCDGHKMKLLKWKSHKDGHIFCCGRRFPSLEHGQRSRRCQKKISIRAGSYLDGTHITLKEHILLSHCWALQMSNRKSEKYVGVCDKAVTQW